MTNGKRDYKKQNALYNSKPAQVKAREEQNKGRQAALKAGTAHKGDGTNVDHIKPLSKGGKTIPSNLRVVPASQNHSFSRNKDGSLKSQTSKREASKGKKK
jgi:hypothetical protein